MTMCPNLRQMGQFGTLGHLGTLQQKPYKIVYQMAKKTILNATDVFKNLQDFANRAGATKSSFTLEREDGWKWQFTVISPTFESEEEEEQKE